MVLVVKNPPANAGDIRDMGLELPDGPVAKTFHSHYREPGFDPWSGN